MLTDTRRRPTVTEVLVAKLHGCVSTGDQILQQHLASYWCTLARHHDHHDAATDITTVTGNVIGGAWAASRMLTETPGSRTAWHNNKTHMLQAHFCHVTVQRRRMCTGTRTARP